MCCHWVEEGGFGGFISAFWRSCGWLNQFMTFSLHWDVLQLRVWFLWQMRISSSKSKIIVLNWKRVECPLQVNNNLLPKVEEFKYL